MSSLIFMLFYPVILLFSLYIFNRIKKKWEPYKKFEKFSGEIERQVFKNKNWKPRRNPERLYEARNTDSDSGDQEDEKTESGYARRADPEAQSETTERDHHLRNKEESFKHPIFDQELVKAGRKEVAGAASAVGFDALQNVVNSGIDTVKEYKDKVLNDLSSARRQDPESRSKINESTKRNSTDSIPKNQKSEKSITKNQNSKKESKEKPKRIDPEESGSQFDFRFDRPETDQSITSQKSDSLRKEKNNISTKKEETPNRQKITRNRTGDEKENSQQRIRVDEHKSFSTLSKPIDAEVSQAPPKENLTSQELKKTPSKSIHVQSNEKQPSVRKLTVPKRDKEHQENHVAPSKDPEQK